MKKISVFICLQLWLIFCLSVNAQDFRLISDGIEHAKFTRKIKNEPVEVNLLRLDLTKVRLDVVHALDVAIGTETTSSMAMRYGALAAINAGFFRLDKSIFAGDAAGVLMINRNLLSESYQDKIALFIANNPNQTEINFSYLSITKIFKIKNKVFYLSGINRERKDDDLIEFTPYFHRTTLTDNKGLEIIIRKGKVVEINNDKGNSAIPQDGYVISATGKMREQILPFLKIGSKITLYPTGTSIVSNAESIRITRDFLSSEDIVGGVPQLIKNGRIEITWQEEKTSKSFVETKHPRTAVAKLKDGKFLMITVDGRSAESVGMNLPELAEMLLEFGATDAMNLDGGGSTTMFLDGKVVNKPSDKEGERKVGDAILVFPRKIKIIK